MSAAVRAGLLAVLVATLLLSILVPTADSVPRWLDSLWAAAIAAQAGWHAAMLTRRDR